MDLGLCSFLAAPLQGHQSLVLFPDQKQLLVLRGLVLLVPPLLSCELSPLIPFGVEIVIWGLYKPGVSVMVLVVPYTHPWEILTKTVVTAWMFWIDLHQLRLSPWLHQRLEGD